VSYCESCEADLLWETDGIQPVWASPTHTCEQGEPLYDLASKTWDKTCPCIEAMQVDPDCEWHGREARGHQRVSCICTDCDHNERNKT
jgi:hypothetical protein